MMGSLQIVATTCLQKTNSQLWNIALGNKSQTETTAIPSYSRMTDPPPPLLSSGETIIMTVLQSNLGETAVAWYST